MFKSFNVQAAVLAVLATATTVGSIEMRAAEVRFAMHHEQLADATAATTSVQRIVIVGKRV